MLCCDSSCDTLLKGLHVLLNILFFLDIVPRLEFSLGYQKYMVFTHGLGTRVDRVWPLPSEPLAIELH